MDFLWPGKKRETSKPAAERKAVDRRELSPNELYAYTKDLEAQLERSEASRADLLRELEAYTGASANLTWDSTGLLQQRAIEAEMKLARVDKSFQQLAVDHESLLDDFAKLKEAKRLSDQSGREATKKIIRIEDERSFYQKQAVEAMQARDTAEAEASRMQERAAGLESSLTQKAAELRAEQSANAELRQRLDDLQKETDALRREAEIAAQVPALRLDLDETQAALERAQGAHQVTQEAHQRSEQQLKDQAAALEAAQQQAREAAERCHALESDLAAAHEQQARLREELQEREVEVEAAAAAAGRAEAAEAARAAAEERLAECEEARRGVAADLEQARADAAELSEELAAAQASVGELTAKIAEVAAEKLRLLVENAELQERERESNTHEREDVDDAWGAWPWRKSPTVPRHHSPARQAAAMRPQAASATSSS